MAKKKTSWSEHPSRVSMDAEHLDAMERAAEAEPSKPIEPISLPPLEIDTIAISLVGDSELVCHKWSHKAKQQILDKQTQKASSGRQPKDPQQDYQDSLYVIKPAPKGRPFEESTFGFPSIAFKNAAVTACTSLGKSVTKTAARQAFHVVGSLVEIIGTPEIREDMVRVGQGTADIRYRGEFKQWRCVVIVRFNSRLLSAAQVVNLFNTAGFGVGIGEWRPEKDGSSGLFHVETQEEKERNGD
jgi:hypothetical protein